MQVSASERSENAGSRSRPRTNGRTPLDIKSDGLELEQVDCRMSMGAASPYSRSTRRCESRGICYRQFLMSSPQSGEIDMVGERCVCSHCIVFAMRMRMRMRPISIGESGWRRWNFEGGGWRMKMENGKWRMEESISPFQLEYIYMSNGGIILTLSSTTAHETFPNKSQRGKEMGKEKEWEWE